MYCPYCEFNSKLIEVQVKSTDETLLYCRECDRGCTQDEALSEEAEVVVDVTFNIEARLGLTVPREDGNSIKDQVRDKLDDTDTYDLWKQIFGKELFVDFADHEVIDIRELEGV